MSIRVSCVTASLFLLNAVVGCDVEMGGRTGGPVMNESQQATDLAGGLGSSAPAANQNPAPVPQPMPNEQPAAQPAPAEPVGEQSGSHVGERSKEILNAKEIVKDPNWTVAASDPSQVRGFTGSGTVYNRAVALSGTVGLEQWVQHTQALEGRFPTYQELQDYIAQNSVDMPALRVYQHYGYDESTGQVVILENREEKEGRRRELHLDPNE